MVKIMKKSTSRVLPFKWIGLFSGLLFFLLAPLSPIAAEDQLFPYTLGVGAEANQNTREGLAFSYGAALDRHLAYTNGKSMLLVGVKGYMLTDFNSISGTEADVYLRLNAFWLGPGSFFGQLSWGFSGYKEDDIDVKTMLADFTIGYRFFFLGGFYAEPYFRAGFPFRIGFGVMAGHRFAF